MEATLDFPEVKANVPSITGGKNILSIDVEGNIIPVGKLSYRDYEKNRNVRSAWLESDLDGKTHALGSATQHFQVLSHLEAIQPIMDEGYRPFIVNHPRGGAQMVAYFSQPVVEYDDPVQWDRFASSESGTLTPAVRVRSDLRRGHGFTYDLGYFRVVCTNGLVARAFSFGVLNQNHKVFDGDRVHQFLAENPVPAPENMPGVDSSLFKDIADFLKDDPEKIASRPRLLREPLQRINGLLSNSSRVLLEQELREMVDSKPKVTQLDLLNTLTNVSHKAKTPMAIYGEIDPLVNNLVDLVDVSGLINNLPTNWR